KFVEARDALRAILYLQGIAGRDLISAIYREIFALNISEESKVELLDILGEVDYRIAEGASEEVQIMSFLAKLATMAKKK
ncbi:MAG: hypothetical protein QXX21_03085, partial [Nitrososphaerota archaeon]